MDFDTWEPAYEAILDDFGYGRGGDEHARDELAGMVGSFDLARLEHLQGATVAVAGAGPSLADETDAAAGADVVVAASSAAETLREASVGVDLLVTDLDGAPATARELAAEGTPVAVHAHGDNREALADHVPAMDGDQVLPTTQAAPRWSVENFGGFTDGDRAAFLADHLGAAALRFPGWDLDDPSVDDEKRRKLRWAARLLHWLERRRDEQFGLLDGRRGDLALPWL